MVLCTYNGEAHLGEQLDSLLAQTRRPDEIVVGDDGSSDASWGLLLDFASRAGSKGIEVRLFRHKQNLGFVGNFSQMLREASGDLLFLCDQDDVWRSDKLATMEARFAVDPKLLLLCTDACLVDAAGKWHGVTLFDALALEEVEKQAVRDGRAFDVLLRRSMVTGATAALRREAIDKALPVGAGWIHDEWLAIVLSILGRVGMVESPLIDYRQHANNQVGMRKRTWRDKWKDLVCPRRDEFQAEVARMACLEEHLKRLGSQVAPTYLSAVAHKRDHFVARVALGRKPRWRRLPDVLREARDGSYRRYGTGRRSMLRDLLRHD